jgi:hypothetical protein
MEDTDEEKEKEEKEVDAEDKSEIAKNFHKNMIQDAFIDRVKYIPIRLNEKERKQLHLLESALSVSDYTGLVL